MRFARPKEMPEAGFDLTPMIDIVLLLIIFFTLSSQFAQANRHAIPLPAEKGEADVEVHNDSLILDIERNGLMTIAGERVDLAMLVTTVKSVAKSTGAPEKVDLVIRADRDMPARTLNQVASTLAEIGVRNWKLATAGDATPAAAPAGKGAP